MGSPGSPKLRLLSYMTPGFPVSLFEAIADAIDADLELDQDRSGPAPGDDPFRDGRADFGWVCSTSFVELASRARDGALPSVRLAGVAWVPDDPGSAGDPKYFGDIVVRRDSPIASFGDLAGRSIGCNDEVSLSGHHALRIAMAERDLDAERFAELRFTGAHNRSLDGVVDGSLDAAVVDSVVRLGRCRVDEAVADLRVVQRLGPWPVQPLVARVGLAPAVVDRARDALLAANRDPAMLAELAAASLTGFVPVGPDHYRPVADAMAKLRHA